MHTLLYGEVLLTKLFVGNIAVQCGIGIFRASFMLLCIAFFASSCVSSMKNAVAANPEELVGREMVGIWTQDRAGSASGTLLLKEDGSLVAQWGESQIQGTWTWAAQVDRGFEYNIE